MKQFQDISDLKESFVEELNKVYNQQDLEKLKARFLGKKDGIITSLLKKIPTLPPEERREFGRQVNELKEYIEKSLTEKTAELKKKSLEEKLLKEKVNIYLPGRPFPVGKLHPVTKTLQDIVEIFTSLGFEVEEGPEIEDDYHNFEGLNIPPDHPARDMQDTFYIDRGKFLLRTHTSPVQVRVMEVKTPPLKVIAPGRVYRRDFDVSHSPVFHQVEGFAVDVNISFADLRGVISEFVRAFFKMDIPVRFRPSYFPFTEPSAEVDIGCVFCGGEGCRVCGEGWIEVMGCGMIHPQVLRNVNLDPEKFTGFAFGMGVERLAMLRYSISDIRLLFEGNLDFLQRAG